MRFLDLLGLKEFLDNLKNLFSKIGHKHKVDDLEDYTVDSSFSATSTNPVENKAIKAALDDKVPNTRTVNGKVLNNNITLTAEDVGADASGSAADALTEAKSYTKSHIDNTDVHFTTAERTKLAGIETGANKYTHPTSGVTAGTYKSVTVDANGHVTGGSNPTTLAGYGITDAEVKGTSESKVSAHNTATDAHNDIRLLISDISTKLNNFLNVDDTTKDELSEIIALIEDNADDIESITSGKVNVTDIINNLTTNVENKPLSAAQGVVLKGLIDTLQNTVNDNATTAKNYTDEQIATEVTNRNSAISDAVNEVKAYTDEMVNTELQSNYDLWLSLGYEGTPADFVEFLRGKSAYETWVSLEGNEGKTQEEFINSLKIASSNYDFWLSLGYEGTPQDYLDSLRGKSVYETWLEQDGNAGKTEEEFLETFGGAKPEELEQVLTDAKAYTDTQISLVTETGIPKLMVYPLSVVASTENQTTFEIALDSFDANTDTVLVQSGRTMLFPNQDFTVNGKNVVLNEGVPSGRTIGIYVFKNVPIGDEGSVSGTVISAGSIPWDRMEENGTVQGYLNIEKESNPFLNLCNGNTGRIAYIESRDDTDALFVNYKDPSNKTCLYIPMETSDITNAVMYARTVDGNATKYKIYGEHNKPYGFYNGNGDATSRTINIGGFLHNGTMLAICSPSAGRSGIISSLGGIFWKHTGEVVSLPMSECNYTHGVLTLVTASDFVNYNGIAYYYNVL